ncbi:bifunctional 2',3'-cyclic-nucleotide 2'-phosphodiesterase/3'-nucleotidase [Endozoicomonadaceae bacterium StTr2]
MKKTLIAVLVGSAVALMSGCDSDDNDSPAPAKVTAQLRVMETSDIHANVMDFDYYKGREDITIGLARTAAVVATARDEVKNAVLVDNGDLIQGSPMGDFVAAEFKKGNEFSVHPAHKAMNTMDYVVGNIGNHEFNYGLDFLKKAIDGADFPYINANVICGKGWDCWGKKEGDNLFTPYQIVEKTIKDDAGVDRTIKVGYIGFVPPQILMWDKQNLTNGDGSTKVTVLGIQEAAKKFVPEMKQKGADLIIAIPHSGVGTAENPSDVTSENATYALTLVDGIDAIMFGHSHSVFPGKTFSGDKYADLKMDLEKGTINGVPAVMPGRWGDNMGQVDFQLELVNNSWKIVSGTAKARSIYEKNEQGQKVATADVTGKQQVVDAIHGIVEADHTGTLAYVDAPIGKSDYDMYSFLSLVQDDPTVQIVADAQIAYAKKNLDKKYAALPVLSAAAPFKSGGRHSTLADADSYVQVAKGNLSYKNAADLYLYPNTVVALKVNGAQVKDWLECSANQFNQIDPASTAAQTLINWDGHRTYNFDVIDGEKVNDQPSLTYQIDVTQPSKFDGSCKVANAGASRIVDLTWTKPDGTKVQGDELAAQEFIVVSNNYRAFGGKFAGTGAEFVVQEFPDMNRDAVAAYITEESQPNSGGSYDSSVDPRADNNWKFKVIETSTALDVLFETQNSDLASQFVETYKARPMTKVGKDELGFARYQIDLKAGS